MSKEVLLLSFFTACSLSLLCEEKLLLIDTCCVYIFVRYSVVSWLMCILDNAYLRLIRISANLNSYYFLTLRLSSHYYFNTSLHLLQVLFNKCSYTVHSWLQFALSHKMYHSNGKLLFILSSVIRYSSLNFCYPILNFEGII